MSTAPVVCNSSPLIALAQLGRLERLQVLKADEIMPSSPPTVVRRMCEGGKLVGVEELDFDAIERRIKECFPAFKGNMYSKKDLYFTLEYVRALWVSDCLATSNNRSKGHYGKPF